MCASVFPWQASGFAPFAALVSREDMACVWVAGAHHVLFPHEMPPPSSPSPALTTPCSRCAAVPLNQVVVSEKIKNLRRLEAQRNELNAKGTHACHTITPLTAVTSRTQITQRTPPLTLARARARKVTLTRVPHPRFLSNSPVLAHACGSADAARGTPAAAGAWLLCGRGGEGYGQDEDPRQGPARGEVRRRPRTRCVPSSPSAVTTVFTIVTVITMPITCWHRAQWAV
jgi:hypothetical protein